jgi:CRP-like cAMP-binding protein
MPVHIGGYLYKFDENEPIIRDGISGSKMIYVLEAGIVGVYKDSLLIAKISKSGSIFGEMSVLLDIPRTADVIALRESTVMEIPFEIDHLFTKHPEISMKIARILALRLQDITLSYQRLHVKLEEIQRAVKYDSSMKQQSMML